MAELILTDEEKDAASYLDWSNESLGKAVKVLAKSIQDRRGKDAIAIQAYVAMLACLLDDNGKRGIKLTAKGVTEYDEPKGDWAVTIERISGPGKG